jgi:hypothetical protein
MLARKAGEDVDADELTNAEASMKIDELRAKTGFGSVPTKPKRLPPRRTGRAGPSGGRSGIC